MGLCFRARPFIFLASKLSSFVATVTTRASEYRISWKGELSSLWQELPVPLACWSPIAHTMRNGTLRALGTMKMLEDVMLKVNIEKNR